MTSNRQPYMTQLHIDANLLQQLNQCGWRWKMLRPFADSTVFCCRMSRDGKVAFGYGQTLDEAAVKAARVATGGGAS